MWCGLCVCVLVTTVSFYNDELIEVLFGIWTWVVVGPRNHILCGDLDLPRGRSIFFGGGGCSCQFVVNYRACLVCNRYSQRYLVDGNGDAYFYVCCYSYSCMYVQDKYSLLTYLWSALLLWYAAGSM